MSKALLENFDLLATSVGGVAKLRELILSLAVRGRLVAQDPSDEPASELLKRIRAEKDRLIAEGKIKRDKPMPPVSEEEQPYELPAGWEWARFSDFILASDAGWSPSCDSSPRTGDNWGVLKVSAVTWGEFRPGENKALPDHLDPRPECEVQAGDFLLSRANTEELVARSVVAWSPPARLMLSDKLIRLKLSKFINKTLLCLINNSTDSRRHYIAHASGTSSSMKNVSREVVLSLPVPLPPAGEQSRIVAKVEELMALCDRLEAEQGHAARVQGHWVEAALDQLAESADADEFRRHWQHLAANFDTLFTTPESIDRLDATLLQLAVRGKLVPQDPNDEPPSELLTQIRAEKDRLIKEGKIKRDKPLPPIPDEKPFELPPGWDWVRLGALLSKIGAGSTPLGGKEVYTNSGVKFLRSQNVWNDGLRLTDVAYIPAETHARMSGTVVLPKDILFNITGASIGRCALVADDFDEANVSQHVTIVRPALPEIRQFLHVVLTSNHVQQTVMDVQVGVSREGLSIGKLGQFLIPLPPLAEQARIVSQLENLQALTASLKARLTAAQTKQAHLAEALIADATTPTCAALIEGENSGPAQPFDLEAFKARMKAELG